MGSLSCQSADQIVMYVIGEITTEEKELFQKHIETCSSCREEVEHLKKPWEIIPFNLNEVEPPADLKDEVMNAIFPASASSKRAAGLMRLKHFFNQLQPVTYKWITTALLIALGGTLWNNVSLREQLQAVEEQPGIPAQVLQEYSLKAADPTMATAKGNAWLFQQGNKKRLVFHLQGLSATQGAEAYQIWLIHDGKRKSAGVFHVDEQGNGVVTYEFNEQTSPFQAIGITLEPDANGMKPRGKKVLGT